jgi:hypothetical protein
MSVNTPASWSSHALRTQLVMPSGPASVDMLKWLTHVGHGEGEPTVLGSGPRQWHCAILKVGK